MSNTNTESVSNTNKNHQCAAAREEPAGAKIPREGATPAAAPIDVREVNWSRLAGCWEDTGNQGKASAHTQKTEG